MFFIVGINYRSKPLGDSGCVCPACGKMADLHINKNYSIFTFFFIQIFPFGAYYRATCPNCASVMKLSKKKGKSFERDHSIVIYDGDLHILLNNTGRACPSCGAEIITDQNFCSNCGTNHSLFGKSAFEISRKVLNEVLAFIDENYTGKRDEVFSRKSLRVEIEPTVAEPCVASQISMPPPSAPIKERVFEKWPERLDKPFSVTLFRLIEEKGKSDAEVYKRANIDRRLFSKIRTDRSYRPKKETIIAFALALELTLAETADLLKRAGFALSRSVLFDVIVEYFITRGKYDIFEINNVLFKYDQPILGWRTRD